MFDRIKKAFSKPAQSSHADTAPASQSLDSRLRSLDSPVSEWAATQGLVFAPDEPGSTLALEGRVQGKRWRLEHGRPTRDYVKGDELRARAHLGLNEDIAVLVMNRALKEVLEKQAYQSYTDDLRTSVDPHLPQEVRWLAMFEEYGWETLPMAFFERYSVLSDRRENALGWIDPGLAQAMLDWPEPGPSDEVPFMLLLLRGKAYMRMEYRPTDLATMQHAALIFTKACESALSGSAEFVAL